MEDKILIAYLIAGAVVVVTLAVLLFGGPADASTVTYTDAAGAPTATVSLRADGRFAFRIKAADSPSALPTKSVLVTDDTGQMAPWCYQVESGQTIAVTSEVVVAAQPIVVVTGRSYENPDCTGSNSVPSNPITVELVPEPPELLAPLPE